MRNSNNFAGQYVVKLPYLLAFSENIPQTNFRKEFLCGLPRVLSNVLKYFLILVPGDPLAFVGLPPTAPSCRQGQIRRKKHLHCSMSPWCPKVTVFWRVGCHDPTVAVKAHWAFRPYARNIEKTITIHNPSSSSIIISSSFFSSMVALLLLLIILRGLHIILSPHIINDNKFKCNSKKI